MSVRTRAAALAVVISALTIGVPAAVASPQSRATAPAAMARTSLALGPFGYAPRHH